MKIQQEKIMRHDVHYNSIQGLQAAYLKICYVSNGIAYLRMNCQLVFLCWQSRLKMRMGLWLILALFRNHSTGENHRQKVK